MTTQAEAPKKVYETKLVSIETINSKTGDFYKSPILVFPALPGLSRDYPCRFSVSQNVAETVKPGVLYRLELQRGGVKANLTEADKRTPREPKYDSDYFWNVSEIKPGGAAPVAPPPPKTPPAPAAPTATPQPQSGHPAPAVPQSMTHVFDERTRTMVLAYAKDLAVAHMQMGNPFSLTWMASRYNALLEMLATGEIQRFPDDEHEAQVEAHLRAMNDQP